jgi:hypothetical protein
MFYLKVSAISTVLSEVKQKVVKRDAGIVSNPSANAVQ